MAPRPRVFTKPTADTFHVAGERIIEYVFPSGRGGLIALGTLPNGTETLTLYQHDEDIHITVKRIAPRRVAVARTGPRLPDNTPAPAPEAELPAPDGGEAVA